MRALRQKAIKKLTLAHTASQGRSQNFNQVSMLLLSECILLPSELKLAKQTTIPDMKEDLGLSIAGSVPRTWVEIPQEAGVCT